MSDNIVERLRDSDTTRRIGESYADVHDRRQADRNEAADTIAALTARVEELEGTLCLLLSRLSKTKLNRDELAAIEAARAAITKGEREG